MTAHTHITTLADLNRRALRYRNQLHGLKMARGFTGEEQLAMSQLVQFTNQYRRGQGRWADGFNACERAADVLGDAS